MKPQLWHGIRPARIVRISWYAAWKAGWNDNVGIEDYVRKFIELCPDRPISHEVIVMQQRPTRIFDPKFWEPYKNVRASEFVRFLALAEAGKALPAPRNNAKTSRPASPASASF